MPELVNRACGFRVTYPAAWSVTRLFPSHDPGGPLDLGYAIDTHAAVDDECVGAWFNAPAPYLGAAPSGSGPTVLLFAPKVDEMPLDELGTALTGALVSNGVAVRGPAKACRLGGRAARELIWEIGAADSLLRVTFHRGRRYTLLHERAPREPAHHAAAFEAFASSLTIP